MYIIIKTYCEISFKPNCVWFQLMSFRDDLEILEQGVSSFLLVLYVQLSFQILKKNIIRKNLCITSTLLKIKKKVWEYIVDNYIYASIIPYSFPVNTYSVHSKTVGNYETDLT